MKFCGRNKGFYIEPKIEPVNEPVIETPSSLIKEPTNLELIIKQKNFRQEKYLELVKQFMEKHCEYEFMNMISHNEIKAAYNNFIRNSSDSVKNLNISFALSPKDINSLDNRFTYKRVHICKSCGNRQFTGCCDEYHIKNRTSLYFMINIKLREL
jgi:hypothetical protein